MKLASAALSELAAAALVACGAASRTGVITAKYLVRADEQGIATHGVARVPTYCAHLKSGRTDGKATPRVLRERPAAILIDAGNGLGFEPCEYALEQAVRRAQAHGCAYAAVTNSHHCGALGVMLEPVAAQGMVALAFSNAAAAIVPWGGKRPVFGTNPVAAVFPRRAGEPLVVDLSLTQVTRGEIMLRAQRGEAIPEGWGKDSDGNPTTDAQKIMVGGSLHAVGGLKGTMLAMMVELLCCALTGAALSHEVEAITVNDAAPMRLGQGFLVIDPAALAGVAEYAERVETLVTQMLVDTEVRLPGARRHALAASAAREGIEIPQAVARQLAELARG